MDGDKFPTYDDDACLSADCPDLSSLDVVNGDAFKLSDGVSVLLFWAKYDKGGCEVFEAFNALNDSLKDTSFLGISCDPERKHVLRFLEKKEFPCNFSLAFDAGKSVFGAFKKVSSVSALGIPHAFVIKDNKIQWHQQFSQVSKVSCTNFEDQLKKVIAGEKLASAGNRPVEEAEESSSDDGVELGDDDDLALF